MRSTMVIPMGYRNVTTMGHVMADTLQNEVYSIGFIASEGTMGTWAQQPQPVPAPTQDSLEGLLASTTLDNAFVDFRNSPESGRWLQGPLISAPLGYSPFTANWTRVLDGMIFTRSMKPTSRFNLEAPTYTSEERSAASCTDVSKLGCGLGLDQFTLIPPGTFQMGSSTGADTTALPVRRVTISRPFYLQKTEVTQEQWVDVMGENPSFASSCGDSCSVEQVSWDDIQRFLQLLNAQGSGAVYRLPTEAEWEYAARAGTTGSTYGELDIIAWYLSNSDRKLHPVARKQANAWGLYDMIGNVNEWVSDWFGPYLGVPATDPRGADMGTSRVLRGGSFGSGAQLMRADARGRFNTSLGRSPYVGFRLAKDK